MFALCVDDEQLSLQALVRMVQKAEGISGVWGFKDEIEALAWAANHPLDIAFLDIQLHEMDGIEVAEKLLKLHPDVSIVFCTGYERYAVKALGLHIDAGYLMKPYRASSLQEEIDHVLKKHEKLLAGKRAGQGSTDKTGQAPEQDAAQRAGGEPASGSDGEKNLGPRKVEIRMMGEFSIHVEGKENGSLLAKTKKGTAFFAYLLLNDGIRVSRQRLLNLFWPEYLYANPDSAFKTMVSRLRKMLNDLCPDLEDCIVSDSGTYYFRLLPGMTADVLRIRQIFRVLPEKSAGEERRSLQRELMQLYTGDLYFPGDVLEAEEIIVDLHKRYLFAMADFASELIDEEDLEQAMEVCRRALYIDPFDEPLYMLVMKILKAQGDMEGIQREYEQLCALSGKHLGTEPSEEMRQFYRELTWDA